ncbi:dihydrofolate reductase family protein [Glycomyces sp. NRRL B-16210]|uniref:dihydrofolate reductase family protein n=1 Tax=Glycomyces sp. NRRL B-16210 TaxID=1463821 RepID=UPI0004BF7EDA|nr:dihydrofolate reductase family protein [Glycomyces sp. NRRL B-16210]
MRELTYYVGVSIDGYIAGPGGEFDRLPIEPDVTAAMSEVRPETVPTAFRELMGLEGAPNRSYDTVLMGRGSYEPALKEGITSPYAHLRQYVFSKSLSPEESAGVTLVGADPLDFVRGLKAQEGLGIWLCGGGKLAAALAPEIDEIVLKRYPVVFGGGISMFDGPYEPRSFVLAENRTFDSGAAVQTYRKE